MKPSEVYALPDMTSSPWYSYSFGGLETAFGVGEYEIDEDGAKAAQADAVVYHEKLSAFIDSETWLTISALTFEGKPFAIHTRGGEHRDEFYVTDQALFEAARSYVLKWRTVDQLQHTVVENDQDIPEMTDVMGMVAVDVGAGVRLLNANYFDRDGKLFFDPDLFEASFDALLRKHYNPRDMVAGFQDAEMRAIAAKVFAAAVPDGLDVVEVNEFEDRNNPHWIGAVVATDEGTYALGVSSYSTKASYLSWGSHRVVLRLGGPEAIEAFRPKAPSP